MKKMVGRYRIANIYKAKCPLGFIYDWNMVLTSSFWEKPEYTIIAGNKPRKKAATMIIKEIDALCIK